MESKALFYGGECINKNAFHKKIEPIGIDKIEFKKIMLFDKTSYGNSDIDINPNHSFGLYVILLPSRSMSICLILRFFLYLLIL